MSRPSDLPPAAFGESSGFGPAGFLAETAYAKINLALHVRARREDGYHELETFFAFVDAGDELVASPALADGLTLRGEFAPQLEGEDGNLVLDALALLPRPGPWAIALDKRLPVAAGLGGGSADVGAVFRLVAAACGLPPAASAWSAICATPPARDCHAAPSLGLQMVTIFATSALVTMLASLARRPEAMASR